MLSHGMTNPCDASVGEPEMPAFSAGTRDAGFWGPPECMQLPLRHLDRVQERVFSSLARRFQALNFRPPERRAGAEPSGWGRDLRPLLTRLFLPPPGWNLSSGQGLGFPEHTGGSSPTPRSTFLCPCRQQERPFCPRGSHRLDRGHLVH